MGEEKKIDYKCCSCGKYQRDWWVEHGIVGKDKAWCDECRNALAEQLAMEKNIEDEG